MPVKFSTLSVTERGKELSLDDHIESLSALGGINLVKPTDIQPAVFELSPAWTKGTMTDGVVQPYNSFTSSPSGPLWFGYYTYAASDITDNVSALKKHASDYYATYANNGAQFLRIFAPLNTTPYTNGDTANVFIGYLSPGESLYGILFEEVTTAADPQGELDIEYTMAFGWQTYLQSGEFGASAHSLAQLYRPFPFAMGAEHVYLDLKIQIRNITLTRALLIAQPIFELFTGNMDSNPRVVKAEFTVQNTYGSGACVAVADGHLICMHNTIQTRIYKRASDGTVTELAKIEHFTPIRQDLMKYLSKRVTVEFEQQDADIRIRLFADNSYIASYTATSETMSDEVGFASFLGCPADFSDARVTTKLEFVPDSTIDPNETPMGAINRLLEGRYLKMQMRHNEALRVWSPEARATDWTVPADRVEGSELFRTDFRRVRTMVRQSGGEWYKEAKDDVLAQDFRPRFEEYDNPYIETEAETELQAGKQLLRAQSEVSTRSITIPYNPLIEPEDVLELYDGTLWIISDMTITVQDGMIEQALNLRKYVYGA